MRLTIYLLLGILLVSLAFAVDEAQVIVGENTVIFTACTAMNNETNVSARITIYDSQNNLILPEQNMELVSDQLYKYTYMCTNARRIPSIKGKLTEH